MNITHRATVMTLTGILLYAPLVLAKKPETPGNNSKNVGQDHQVESKKTHSGQEGYFDDIRRSIISDYFGGHRQPNNCPPGLARKNNGCQPPGQAKRWQVGHPLPADITYHDLPHELLHHLGRTPEGQKLVRVGTDILLISAGTGLVLDAIDDLGDVF